MNPAAIYKTLVETGSEMAQKRYEWEVLDGQTKPMLASLTLEAKSIEQCSVAEATNIALASASYRDHLKEVAKARLGYGLAEVAYKASEALWRAQQTEEANQRAADKAAP